MKNHSIKKYIDQVFVLKHTSLISLLSSKINQKLQNILQLSQGSFEYIKFQKMNYFYTFHWKAQFKHVLKPYFF